MDRGSMQKHSNFAFIKFCLAVLPVAKEVTDHATQEAAKTMATKAFSWLLLGRCQFRDGFSTCGKRCERPDG